MLNLLNIAIEASLKAGEAIMKVYNSNDFEVEIKNDDSPLTRADKNANDVINSFIESTEIPIISEENKQIDYSVRKTWKRCWIVDPVDGTKEFIKRNGEFTVNIALVEDGVPVMGVIYVPVSKTLYYATEGCSNSFKANLDSHDTSIEDVLEMAAEIKAIPDGNKARIVGSRSHLNDETKAFISEIEQNEEVEIVSKGSSLKFCLVAEGKADIYPRYAPTMEWDTAAGQAICMAAGVSVNKLPENTPLLYNKENLLNPWFLVSNR
ncbi:MAG: 3'(2'),5'-bisphosphate nucleotidase CysQ [Flavobacteriaceae bacterium]|nr:3'(2'),5'-bisphosphate nucleotidase CysQ [Flavobacteriaceae bacterium]